MSEDNSSKICKQCGVMKELSEYTEQKNGKFGRTSRCRTCVNENNKVYRDTKSPPHLRPKIVAAKLWEQGLRKCPCCSETKALTEFHKVRRPNGYKPGGICKKCTSEKYGKWWRQNKAKRRAYYKQYDAAPENRERKKSYRYERYIRNSKDPRYVMQCTLSHAINRCPTENPATIDDLMVKWNANNGCCAVSGIKLTWGKGGVLPTSISLDRIDPNGGYSKDNLRLICHAINAFRGRGTDAEMLIMAKAIVAHMEPVRDPLTFIA